MTVEYIDVLEKEMEKQAVWKLLLECDADFYPKLSERETTAQKALGPQKTLTTEPVHYFEALQKQKFLLVKEDNNILGFLSFIHDYRCEEVMNEASNYITTICVALKERGRGISNLLYDYMETSIPNDVKMNDLLIRTWSTNEVQIHTLCKRGYQLWTVLKDDRGPGVDTNYYRFQIK